MSGAAAKEGGDLEADLRLCAARLDAMGPGARTAPEAAEILRRMVALLASGESNRVVPQFAALSPFRGAGDVFQREFAAACQALGVRAFSAQQWHVARYYFMVAQLNGLDGDGVRQNIKVATHNASISISNAIAESAKRARTEVSAIGEALSPTADMEMRVAALSRKLVRLNALQDIAVGVVTPNLFGMVGNTTLLREGVERTLFGRAVRVSTYPSLSDLLRENAARRFDVVICTNNAVHTQDHFIAVHDFRKANEDCITAVWLWDSHHLHEICSLLSYIFELAVPAHEIATNFLKAVSPNVLGCVPAGVFQWTAEEARAYFRIHAGGARSDALYGGFIAYHGYERDRFIERCRAEIPDNALYLRAGNVPVEKDDYRRLSPEGQFAAWMSYKTSLVATIKTDIPVRLFDALLAGQIPLVPTDLEGFDQLVPIRLQHELPILRYNRHSVDSVVAAHRQAVAAFDAEGIVGAVRRHGYAVDGHMMVDRIDDILGKILLMARSLG